MSDSLKQYEHWVMQSLLSSSPDVAFDALGHSRWRNYRRMVQTRFYDLLGVALPRLFGLCSDEMAPMVDRWLNTCPPTSHYFRAVPGQFVKWAIEKDQLSPIDEVAEELALYELALWEVPELPNQDPVDSIVDFAWELPPKFSSDVRLLEFQYQVHSIVYDDNPVNPRLAIQEPTRLCVYRDPQTFLAKVLALSPFAFGLIKHASSLSFGAASTKDIFPVTSQTSLSMKQLVEQLAKEDNQVINGEFLSSVVDLLDDWISRGLLLGSIGGANE